MASPAAMAVGASHPATLAAPTPPRAIAVYQILASSLWIPQAALIAFAIGIVASDQTPKRLGWIAFGIFLIGIARAIFDAIGSRRAFRAGRDSATQLRLEAVHALTKQSPLDAGRSESGRSAAIIAEQAELIVPFVARFDVARAKAAIVPGLIFAFVLFQSWAAAFVLLIAAPLIPVFMMLIGWRAKEASEAQLAEAGDMNAFLLDRLRGITTIRALDAVDETAARLRANAEDLRTRTMGVLRIAFLSSAVLELFSALGVAMVAVYVGFHLLGQLNFGTWGAPLELSQALFILLLAPAFFEPLRELSSVWHDRAAGEAAIGKLRELVATGNAIVGNEAPVPRPSSTVQHAPSVVIKNLHYRYRDGDALALDNVDLTIASGEHVALLGASGSGKSTLLALLAGLAPTQSGSISIGERNLTAETAFGIRSEIGWIGQKPHIFAGTIESNVTLGRLHPRGAILNALEFAKLNDIARTRAGDPVGEKGIGLSGGEALRLAIARIAVQPAVGLIIADEPTAHLDSETAREISDNLIALARGKTLVVATHDLSLARRMDRIVQLDARRWENAA